MMNGQNTYSKSVVKQSVAISLSRVPAELLSAVHGNYCQCVVQRFIHTSPKDPFFLRTLLLPWNSSLAPYFSLKLLSIDPPQESLMTILGVDIGIF